MNLLIVKKENCIKAANSARKLIEICSKLNLNICHEKDFKGKDVNFGIALGGDGTMLKLSSLIQSYSKKPIVASFSLGTLGFLLPLSNLFKFTKELDSMESVIHNMLDGKNLKLLNRMRLKCNFKGQEFHALNEIVVHRGLKPHLTRLDVFSENELLTDVVVS